MTSGIGALFLTIGKCTHAFKSSITHKLQQLFKIGFCLTGVSHHERRAQMYAGYFTTNARQEIIGLLLGNMTQHLVEHVVTDVLQGNVEIFAHIVMTSHYRQQVIGKSCRVGIVETNPLNALDLSHLVNKHRQAIFAIKILSII